MAFTPSFHDLAHLGHLELLTPKPEESLAFFTKIVGLHESGRSGDSVYLRAWGDYERASLKLTAAKTSGLGHVAFRTRSEQVLTQLVEHLGQQGIKGAGPIVKSAMGRPSASPTQMGTGSKFTTKRNASWRPATRSPDSRTCRSGIARTESPRDGWTTLTC